MKINLIKSTLDSAIAILSKFIGNAKPHADVMTALTFRTDRTHVWLTCTLSEQQLSLRLEDAACDTRNTSVSVRFDAFIQMLAAVKAGNLTLESDKSKLSIKADGTVVGSIDTVTSPDASLFKETDTCDSTVLPMNFQSFLHQAFSCASTDVIRKALTGVNISSRGIAGTDGKQLFYLPLPVKLNNPVTLPPSKNYNLLKSFRWNILKHWNTVNSTRMFAILGDNFKYVTKALDEDYPQFWKVIPSDSSNDISFTLTEESAQKLLSFINETREEAKANLTVFPNRLEIKIMTVNTQQKREGTFSGKSNSMKLPFSLHMNPVFLKQFISMGFLTFRTSSKGNAPIVSLNGIGEYLFMPCVGHEESESVRTHQPVPEPKPNVSITTINTPPSTTTDKQEKSPMTQNTLKTTTAYEEARSYPQPLPKPPQVQEQSNSLEEALSSFARMREQLTILETRLLEASRKVKTALLEQRQKDRAYQDATRKLERIRMAV